MAQLETEHPDDLRVVYRDFPLMSIHDKAGLASQAAAAASLQGKFWEMHEILYANQAEWSALSVEGFGQWLSARAADLEMDVTQFEADLGSGEIVAAAERAWEDGQQIGLPGTPFLLINGQIYSGPRDVASLDQIIRLIALGERQFTSCPPTVIDPAKQYLATLHTEKGDVVIQLYADKAPTTVNSFVFLAQEGWFDGVTFHRVLPGFVAQTGDPSGTGSGNPGYFFGNEIDPSLSFDRPGVVGMANSGADTNGSQFFITFAPAADLDGKYTIFGQVISGMDVLAQLTPRDPQMGVALPPGDELVSVTIEEK
ncbi:MAG: thioredoxin domain-containing protein [Chloroflexi bacterium]|nr:thioredoxin domain-containing protein [Chloroflexota bacterium]